MSFPSMFISWLSDSKPCYLPGLDKKDYVFYTKVKHFNIHYTAESGAYVNGLSYYLDKKLKKVKDVVLIHIFIEDRTAANSTARFRAIVELFKRPESLGKVQRERKIKLHNGFDIIKVPNLNLFNIPIEKLQGVCNIIFATSQDDPISIIQKNLLKSKQNFPIYVCRFALESSDDKKILKCVMERMFSRRNHNGKAQKIDLNDSVTSFHKTDDNSIIGRKRKQENNIEKLSNIASFEYVNSCIKPTLTPKNISYLKNVPKSEINSLSDILLEDENGLNKSLDKEKQTNQTEDNFTEIINLENDLNSSQNIQTNLEIDKDKNWKEINWKEIAQEFDRLAEKEFYNKSLEITPNKKKKIIQEIIDLESNSDLDSDYHLKDEKSKNSNKSKLTNIAKTVKRPRKKLFFDKNLKDYPIDVQNKDFNDNKPLKNTPKQSKRTVFDQNSESGIEKKCRKKLFSDKNLKDYPIDVQNKDFNDNKPLINTPKQSKLTVFHRNSESGIEETVKKSRKKLFSDKNLEDYTSDLQSEDLYENKTLKNTPNQSKRAVFNQTAESGIVGIVKKSNKKLFYENDSPISGQHKDSYEKKQLKNMPNQLKWKDDFSESFIKFSDSMYDTKLSELTTQSVKTTQKRLTSEILDGEKPPKNHSENIVEENLGYEFSKKLFDKFEIDSNLECDLNSIENSDSLKNYIENVSNSITNLRNNSRKSKFKNKNSSKQKSTYTTEIKTDEIQSKLDIKSESIISYENSSKRKNEKSNDELSSNQMFNLNEIVPETTELLQKHDICKPQSIKNLISYKNSPKHKFHKSIDKIVPETTELSPKPKLYTVTEIEAAQIDIKSDNIISLYSSKCKNEKFDDESSSNQKIIGSLTEIVPETTDLLQKEYIFTPKCIENNLILYQVKHKNKNAIDEIVPKELPQKRDFSSEIQSNNYNLRTYKNLDKRKNEYSDDNSFVQGNSPEILPDTTKLIQKNNTFFKSVSNNNNLIAINDLANENYSYESSRQKIVPETTKLLQTNNISLKPQKNNGTISLYKNSSNRNNENDNKNETFGTTETVYKTDETNLLDISLEKGKRNLLKCRNLRKRKNKNDDENKYKSESHNFKKENCNSLKVYQNTIKCRNENVYDDIIEKSTIDILDSFSQNKYESNLSNSTCDDIFITSTIDDYESNPTETDLTPPRSGPKRDISTELSNNKELELRSNNSNKKKRAVKTSKRKLTSSCVQIESRATVLAPLNNFELARSYLNNSEILTGRENEFNTIVHFIKGKFAEKKSGSMYISGVPGTGKTETVSEIRRCLERQLEEKTIDDFKFVYVNALALTEPRQIYVEIVKQMSKEVMNWDESLTYIHMYFLKPNNLMYILIIDELDKICTRKQDVIYNLLDLPSISKIPVVIIAISNTADLPEKLFDRKVRSRLGLTRLNFRPYKHQEMIKIIKNRLKEFDNLFKSDALEYICRKVASLSGDARRAITICNRAMEIAETSGEKEVTMKIVYKTLADITSSPKIQAIQSCSKTEKIILQALVSETSRTGNDEVPFFNLMQVVEEICLFLSMKIPNAYMILRCCRKLKYFCLIVVEDGLHDISSAILLNVSSYDIKMALKDVYE